MASNIIWNHNRRYIRCYISTSPEEVECMAPRSNLNYHCCYTLLDFQVYIRSYLTVVRILLSSAIIAGKSREIRNLASKYKQLQNVMAKITVKKYAYNCTLSRGIGLYIPYRYGNSQRGSIWIIIM